MVQPASATTPTKSFCPIRVYSRRSAANRAFSNTHAKSPARAGLVETRGEAAYWESWFAAQYGLPTACFHAVGRDLAMDDELLAYSVKQMNQMKFFDGGDAAAVNGVRHAPSNDR